jgi:hypothetical protein
MNVYWLLNFFFLHWIGDFVCQPRWVAENKSKNFFALLLHGLIYTTILAGGTILVVPNSTPLYQDPWMMWLGMNAILHLIVDFFTSKVTAQMWEAKKIYGFFTVVGLDQFLHAASLIATTRIFLS